MPFSIAELHAVEGSMPCCRVLWAAGQPLAPFPAIVIKLSGTDCATAPKEHVVLKSQSACALAVCRCCRTIWCSERHDDPVFLMAVLLLL